MSHDRGEAGSQGPAGSKAPGAHVWVAALESDEELMSHQENLYLSIRAGLLIK